MVGWITWDRTVPLGGKWRLLVEKVRERVMESRHLQDCSPRLCRLRTDGLTPVIKYWTYRSHVDVYVPSKPSSHHQQILGFAPTASMVGSREKLGTDPQIGQSVCCGLCWEPFFSRAVALLNSVDDFVKGCYMWTTWDIDGRGSYADRAWKVYDVLIRFCPGGCTSIRIVTTLEYE
jgi:hypothetical protein